MGNADLRSLAAIEDVTFEDVAGSVVAVDAHNWLYRYLTTTVRFTADAAYTTAAGEEVANLIGVVQGLPKFFEHDLTPVFVFDGGVVDMKEAELARRRERKEATEADLAQARERGDAVEVARLDSQTQRLTDTIIETTRGLLARLDVPVVDAPAEGEGQAAHMARAGDVDYVGTEDYDALLFGTPHTVRQLTSSGEPELMDFEATLAELELTWEQLVDAAILMGTDFNEGIEGVGPATAVSLLSEHGDLWTALDAENAHVEHADRIRELFLDPTVERGYTLELDIEPEVGAAREYVVDDWEVAAEEVERGFARIEDALVQTGLDRWS